MKKAIFAMALAVVSASVMGTATGGEIDIGGGVRVEVDAVFNNVDETYIYVQEEFEGVLIGPEVVAGMQGAVFVTRRPTSAVEWQKTFGVTSAPQIDLKGATLGAGSKTFGGVQFFGNNLRETRI